MEKPVLPSSVRATPCHLPQGEGSWVVRIRRRVVQMEKLVPPSSDPPAAGHLPQGEGAFYKNTAAVTKTAAISIHSSV